MEDPYPVENIDRLGVLMFQTSDNSQLLRRVLWINAELTIVSSLKHKNTQPIYIFNRENPQNSEPRNGPRRGLDFIALIYRDVHALMYRHAPLEKMLTHCGIGCSRVSTTRLQMQFSSSKVLIRTIWHILIKLLNMSKN